MELVIDMLEQKRQMVQFSRALLTLVSRFSRVSRVWGQCSRRGAPGRPWAPSIGIATLMLALTACWPVQVDLSGWGQTGAPEVETATYVVRAGDTLSGIAAAHDTTVETLIQLNAATYPGLAESQGRVIVAGWALVMPASRPTANTIRPAAELAPAIDTTASKPAAEGYFDEEAALEIVRLTNEERARDGLTLLTSDDELTTLARQRSCDLIEDFSHAGFAMSGCTWCGENIAGWHFGQTAAGFVNQWVSSPAHHDNMVRSGWMGIGVGVCRFRSSDLAFAVQIFK